MKTKFCSFSAIVAVMLLMAMVLGQSVFADGSVQTELPVEIRLKGDAPSSPDEYRFRLKALDEGAPMPEGAENGEYILTEHGTGDTAFPPITLDRLGGWHYELSQLPGDHPRATYDDTVYLVTIYALSGETQEWETMLVIQNKGDEAKLDKALFVNHYERKKHEEPAVTPDPAAPGTPGGGTLVQTGQLKWPAPVLIAAGVLLIVTGLYLNDRNKCR